MLKFTMSRVP